MDEKDTDFNVAVPCTLIIFIVCFSTNITGALHLFPLVVDLLLQILRGAAA